MADPDPDSGRKIPIRTKGPGFETLMVIGMVRVMRRGGRGKGYLDLLHDGVVGNLSEDDGAPGVVRSHLFPVCIHLHVLRF